jgi:5,10-methylenetetrahydromethanopterin reductase
MVYRDPTVLASSAATVNEMSRGRAILGIGTGDGPVYRLGRTATRLAQFEEGLRTIRTLLQGKSITVRGGKERVEGEISLQVGRLPVPLYVAAEGPRTLGLAGKVADGIIFGGGFDPRVLEWARERVAEGAREEGRDLAEIDIMPAGMISVDGDGAKARELVRARIANRAHHNFRFTLETVPKHEVPGVTRFMEAFDITRPIEERVAPKFVTDYLVQRFAIAGTPEECIARVKALKEAGVRRLMLTPPNKIYGEVMRRWAGQVMKRFL